jgi:hypothetical protein
MEFSPGINSPALKGITECLGLGHGNVTRGDALRLDNLVAGRHAQDNYFYKFYNPHY